VTHGRVRDLEFLAAKQNDRMVDVLRHANNAEERYRERQAKWQLVRRESHQATIARRRE
jgi:hypothetical protein